MRLVFIFPLLFLVFPRADAQSIFDALYHSTTSEAVEAVLTLPVDSIAGKSVMEQPGAFTFVDTAGKVRTFAAEVSTRGKFRRTRCGNPPLKLDFPKKALRAAGFSDHDKYKLVVDCYDAPDAADLVLKEYLAYRAYALLSPEAHLRTQLLRLTLRDAAAVRPDRVIHAFIIEDTDEMAVRSGGKELESALGIGTERYAAEAATVHAMFQFMIGNVDWSLLQHRNVKVVELPDGSLLPVPYDFDFSGWVGAPYASPSGDLGQSSIYQRIYLGADPGDRMLRSVSKEFRDHRRELLRMIATFELLPRDERTVLSRYVGQFYEQLSRMSVDPSVPAYHQLSGKTAAP